MPVANKRSIKPQPLSEEQVKQRQAQFFMQKRESFAQGILYNLCNNPSSFETAMSDPDALVRKSVEIADSLMRYLFVEPIPELKPAGQEEK